MKRTTPIREADEKYAAAHDSHYVAKNLGAALTAYLDIRGADPESAQAGYARAQIQNMARSLVSEQDRLGAQVDLIRAHLQAHGSTT